MEIVFREKASGTEVDTKKICFIIVRNNKYIQDKKLIEWVNSKVIESIPYVDYKYLRGIFKGIFELDPLEYEEWAGIQKIKKKIEHIDMLLLPRLINTIGIVLGYMTVVFSMFFFLFYWFDLFNIIDISIINILTLGVLYPVENGEMREYMKSSGRGKHYITLGNAVVICMSLAVLGVVFVNINIVVRWVIRLYIFIMSKM